MKIEKEIYEKAWKRLLKEANHCTFHHSCITSYSESVSGGMCQCFSDILQEEYERYKNENRNDK